MKLLVATHQAQGERPSDFCFVPEGEIVRFGFECDRDRQEIDGGCGCRRSMSGLLCSKGTTTMLVIERPDLTSPALHDLIRLSLQQGGWAEGMTSGRLQRAVADEARRLIAAARPFAPGAIVEKRGDFLQIRRHTPHTPYVLPTLEEEDE